jgi:hypothetical protein
VCCFPSGFDPSLKAGKLLKEIHTPVPSYDKIGPSMERFFRKIEAGNNVKRTNVSLGLVVFGFFLLAFFALELRLRLRPKPNWRS